MTDRYAALTVVLEQDIRDDDAEGLIEAIRRYRGVLDVKPHVAEWELGVATTRARADLLGKLRRVLQSEEPW